MRMDFSRNKRKFQKRKTKILSIQNSGGIWTKNNPVNLQLSPLFLILCENFQSDSRNGLHMLHIFPNLS